MVKAMIFGSSLYFQVQQQDTCSPNHKKVWELLLIEEESSLTRCFAAP